jgi:3-phenylpropionate/trans-cinnamate dioxygenase ferredoxin reductase subunit
MTENIVIVGGGHAAAQLCACLADAGQGGRVHLVCEEPALPYQRPPLSKTYLKQQGERAQPFRDAAWYAAQGIQVHAGDAAIQIDRAARRMRLASGKELAYARLVIATGTRARSLPSLHAPLANVHTLRNLADADALRACLLRATPGELVVIGGGFIGLEVAATARNLGWQVLVVEAAPRLLSRSASPELSAHLVQFHRELGTRVQLGGAVGGVEHDGARVQALHVNGAAHGVDVMLLGIGAVPETTLAHAAGLEVDNGIHVDPHMVTSDPAILAMGDCTLFEYEGRRVRLESVQNASDQAKVVAATLLGQLASYRPMPFFWSEQGSLRLQMAGLWQAGLECVRRPGANTASFSLFHYAGERLVAVESVNAPVDHMWSRKLLEKGFSPAPERAADPHVPLKSLV